jgi:transposase
MGRLTASDVTAIRRLHADEQFPVTTRRLARTFQCSSATISYWLRCEHLPGATKRLPPKNRRKGMQARRTRVGKLATETVLRNNRVHPKFSSTASIQQELAKTHNTIVTRMTVYNDLKALGFSSRVRPRVPCTDLRDYARRLAFTREIARRGLRGRDIIFSDEKMFTTNDFAARTMWVPMSGNALARENARWPVKLMVWGAIGHNYRCLKILRNPTNDREGYRLTTETYKRHVLQGEVMNHLTRADKVFMQDGAACHTAGATLRYLDNKGVEVLAPWPARSPDLNPIERLWAILQVRVSRHHPSTIDDLARAVQVEWDNLRPETINGVIDDFDVRVQTVASLRGAWPTSRHR